MSEHRSFSVGADTCNGKFAIMDRRKIIALAHTTESAERISAALNATHGIHVDELKQLDSRELGSTLRAVHREMNIIRARDGSPAVYHPTRDGRPMVTNDPAPEYWDELTDRVGKLSDAFPLSQVSEEP